MKKYSVILILTILIMNMVPLAFASDITQGIQVKILSPDGIKDFPGREEIVKVRVSNNTSNDLSGLLVYITMADLKKNMTVNLEDYNADKPVVVDSLKSGESQDIELPVRFVYTSKYYLYVTVANKENTTITSSVAIPIEIMGNTKINKPSAMGVAIGEPLVILGIVILVYGARRKKYKVKV